MTQPDARELLRDCAERMERARDILTEGRNDYWAMLDTTGIRAFLAAPQERVPMRNLGYCEDCGMHVVSPLLAARGDRHEQD